MDANELRAIILPLYGEIADDIVDRIQTCIGRGRHEHEWWNTYRAALTGLYACDSEFEQTPDTLHKWAVDAADKAHGPRGK